jgi:serine/threonine protein kinase
MARRRDRRNWSTTFPGYADVAEIGSGAFATVYRAVETDTNRPVALKALKVETLPAYVVEAFDQEIRALGVVSGHPNVVTLYRPLATPDRRAVLVLELCQESYAQQVRRNGPLSAQETVSVGIKIAGALETAHRAGFLHRDMKPQNILVTQFNEPALADFGVAALRASAQATEGVFGFTTLHASPEILEGRELSPATDVYGLASTLYQLLTGKAPFAAFDGEAPASVILRIISHPVAPLRSEEIPVDLSDLLELSLAKDAADRPQSAATLAEQLRGIEARCGWSTTPYVVLGDKPRPFARSQPPDPLSALATPAPLSLADQSSRSPASLPAAPVPRAALSPEAQPAAALPPAAVPATALPPAAALPEVVQSPAAMPAPPRQATVRGDRNSLVAPAAVARNVAVPTGAAREQTRPGFAPPPGASTSRRDPVAAPPPPPSAAPAAPVQGPPGRPSFTSPPPPPAAPAPPIQDRPGRPSFTSPPPLPPATRRVAPPEPTPPRPYSPWTASPGWTVAAVPPPPPRFSRPAPTDEPDGPLDATRLPSLHPAPPTSTATDDRPAPRSPSGLRPFRRRKSRRPSE